MERMEYMPTEYDLESSVHNLGETIEQVAEKVKGMELSETQKEKFIQTFDKIKWAIIPVLAKSATFGVDQYNQFVELANKTNYFSHDDKSRIAMGVTDTTMTLTLAALRHTKKYLEKANTAK